ncbi:MULTISPECIES: hypothetical protein [Leptolyngbya]|jgi:hypothetical protein|uniref:hypothetical protein n=1 Tax=Leptolyngbya TaxID=47251 RepID=UPI0004765723|nr:MULTISPECIES: hypothetical protein [Leptolyngbya]MBD2371115.1 hypothetical protein [Leptolyngbya sp. FACHB-161]MBD2377583.1 hypothetical protein [Leptolyngbya sp. FACHB-238]MBD2402036.1 hypothetical protein [Leptolyngbya sp. FACHB-239]MBD2408555.1 hypothetical protein [Leptolyngbya sp. FACHB-402]
MLRRNSLIPTTVRQEFDVQDLPARATVVSMVALSSIYGGACPADGVGQPCNAVFGPSCRCPGLTCVPYNIFVGPAGRCLPG